MCQSKVSRDTPRGSSTQSAASPSRAVDAACAEPTFNKAVTLKSDTPARSVVFGRLDFSSLLCFTHTFPAIFSYLFFFLIGGYALACLPGPSEIDGRITAKQRFLPPLTYLPA